MLSEWIDIVLAIDVSRVARLAQLLPRALTVGVVTRPFAFEGRQRSRRAEEGIDELGTQVDSQLAATSR